VQNLVTLADIVRLFDLPHLMMLRYKLCELKCTYKTLSGDAPHPINEMGASVVGAVVSEVRDYCKLVGFENGEAKAYSMGLRLMHYNDLPLDSTWLEIEVENLLSEMTRDVFKNVFVHVKGESQRYANKEFPFGEDVAEAFPSATNDLYEAGNCLAVECNTAAGFHLMRAAEVALWELGRDRQIPLAVAGKIEFAEWGKIIGELEIAVTAIQQWPNSSTKEDAHKFYNAAVVEIRAFNDGWRRHSAHPRPHMPKMELDEALALWGHVFRFMNKLAPKIGERYRTSLIWK
jgi:hypothetical protein